MRAPNWDDPRVQRGTTAAILILVILSIAFVILRTADLIYNRGLLEYGSIQAARRADNLIQVGRTTGGLSLISGMGYPMAVPTLVLALLVRRQIPRNLFIAAVTAFCLYGGYVVLSGNRYILIGPIILCIIAFVLAEGGFKVSRLQAALAVCGACALITFIVVGTSTRFRLSNHASTAETLSVVHNDLRFAVDRDFLNWLAGKPEVVREGITGGIYLNWYAVHGAYEFQSLIEYADPKVQAKGTAQFTAAFYFLRLLGIYKGNERAWRSQIQKNNFYTTFFGPVYLDFGFWGGIVYMAVLGSICGIVWQGVTSRSILCLCFAPFCSNVIFNFSTNNLIQSGIGVILITNILFVWVVFRISCWISRSRGHKVAGGSSQTANP